MKKVYETPKLHAELVLSADLLFENSGEVKYGNGLGDGTAEDIYT